MDVGDRVDAACKGGCADACGHGGRGASTGILWSPCPRPVVILTPVSCYAGTAMRALTMHEVEASRHAQMQTHTTPTLYPHINVPQTLDRRLSDVRIGRLERVPFVDHVPVARKRQQRAYNLCRQHPPSLWEMAAACGRRHQRRKQHPQLLEYLQAYGKSRFLGLSSSPPHWPVETSKNLLQTRSRERRGN
jgi:hypothetical protein